MPLKVEALGNKDTPIFEPYAIGDRAATTEQQVYKVLLCGDVTRKRARKRIS
jgi:hypothetical protein